MGSVGDNNADCMSAPSSTIEGQLFENDDRPSIEAMEERRVAKETFRHQHNLFKIEASFLLRNTNDIKMETQEVRKSGCHKPQEQGGQDVQTSPEVEVQKEPQAQVGQDSGVNHENLRTDELRFDFWLPIRREGEDDDMWRICTGYAVKDYPWISTIRSGCGNVSIKGGEVS